MSASKLFVFSMLAIVLGAGAWWMVPPSAKADLAKKWRGPEPTSTQSGPSTAGAPVQTTIYRWRDAQGQTHFSNTPPKNQKYETVTYRNDSNVVGAQ
jgi:hypothetical protein